ncbi:hypothetical protein [Nocardia implantans]|uniref:Alpha/beta hydrolase n=1 Tax=Nocardia implantans TaxID=3108168 RepID=A0ABU6AT88_9NOCA|nr:MULTISPECIES: hypothetical protein [unclassified Nocardia]MBF6191824.1 hypothetical protein [Nocardia beijingensis]MEA3527864.1 hypothetical protein [Nocardia sp. CDC192]MEB3510384.1 hypothetical protein [Nocardia sp. CDC186]
MAASAGAREVADHHITRLLQPGAMTAALNWYRAIGDDWLHAPRVSVPTTVVWGGGDIAVARAGIDLCGEFVDADYSMAGTRHARSLSRRRAFEPETAWKRHQPAD